MKQNPFSLYDFLGYLIPGAIFLYILNYIFRIDIISLLNILNKNNNDTFKNEIIFALPIILIIITYVTGHIISLTSSFFIEASSIYLYGYPSKYLFTKKHSIFKIPNDENKIIGTIKRIILFVLLLPTSIILVIFKGSKTSLFNQAKTLQEDLGNVVFDKCLIVLDRNLEIKTDSIRNKKETEGLGNDYFRIIYHFIFENSEKHSSKLQNYVALYGFCRNVSFVFLTSFFLSLYFKIMDKCIQTFWTLLFPVLTFLFFTGFVKFYRRYTLEALMGATVFNKH
ncbi:hypothetical protein OA40_16405 [Morganella morganii]|uniref:hypothetical protein n=1 Tax=Morganella morganii TaxID=582 RepID=UPI00062C71DC|nr:hypothetical protein [Morganella morganii]KKY64232.1 hypothetical protein OA40_16405 [Morganella morganii]